MIGRGVPESEVDDLAVDLDRGGEVVKHSRFIIFRELVFYETESKQNYLTRMHVLPMAPSPTMTHFIGTGSLSMV